MSRVEENQQPMPANVLDRAFSAERRNQRWVGDTTELAVPGGRLFLAVLLHRCSRIVVGWAVSPVNDRHLVTRALLNALNGRRPDDTLLHHTDEASPYATDDCRRVLRDNGVTASMSRRGNCDDNAVAEAFLATLKAELGERFASAGEARDKLFDDVEVSTAGNGATRRLETSVPASTRNAAGSSKRLRNPPVCDIGSRPARGTAVP